MIAQVMYGEQQYQVDFGKPLDLSIPIGKVKCFNAPDTLFEPYREGGFVGAVSAGAPVNFFNVALNPHGNGTHTECMGHITKEQESITDSLTKFHFIAKLVSVHPKKKGEQDFIIDLEEIKRKCGGPLPEAIIIRTLPNDGRKLTQNYSGKNPAYLSDKAIAYLVEKNVKHLLIDLPSVDREEDEGMLSAHHLFWKLEKGRTKQEARKDCTITELVYANNSITDGLYFLNLQIAPFELDASPSKPVIYELLPTTMKH